MSNKSVTLEDKEKLSNINALRLACKEKII